MFPFLEEKNKSSQNEKEGNRDDGEWNVEDVKYVEFRLVCPCFEIVGRWQVDIQNTEILSMWFQIIWAVISLHTNVYGCNVEHYEP